MARPRSTSAACLPHDEAGSGPAIVLLHAGIADRSMWAEHVEPLAAAGHRVVALDLPGFGQAVPAPGEQAPWLDVLNAMDALSIERAALVGNSFGGAVALRVALVAPERVSALMLISAPGIEFEPSAKLQAAWEAEEAELERGDSAAAAVAVADAWTLADASAELRGRVAAMQRGIYAVQEGLPDPTAAPDPAEEHPELLAQLDIPALVAAGEHDMPDFLDAAEKLAAALPGARHVVIAGAGHLAPLETPQALRELLLGFLS